MSAKKYKVSSSVENYVLYINYQVTIYNCPMNCPSPPKSKAGIAASSFIIGCGKASIVLLLLLLYGCEPKVGHSKIGEVIAPYVDRDQVIIDSLSRQLPGGLSKEGSRDSLIEVIMPLLVGNPVERPFISWFELKNNWIPLFEDAESLLFYITFEAERVRKEGDLIRASRMLNGAARIYNMEGAYIKGSELSQQAYEIAREVGDSVTMGWVQAYLAEPFIYGKDPMGASVHLDEMLAIGKAINDWGLKGNALIRYGVMYGHVGDFEKFLEYNEQALVIGREHKIRFVEAYAVLNIGFGLNKLGRSQEAIAIVEENAYLAGAESSAIGVLMDIIIFENLYSLEEYDEASAYLDEVCRVSTELGHFFGIGYCKEGASRLYEKGEDHLAALAAYKDYHKYLDEKVGAEAKQKLRALEIEHQISAKDQEIERLEQAEKDSARIHKAEENKMLYSLLALMGGLSVALIWLVAKKEINDVLQRKKVAEAKLQVLQSQMNPHFIFNAMNGIQNYILKSERIEAYSYLSKFGGLLRIITNSSTSIGIELEQEIKLLQNYLELEKLRFRDHFDYSLTVSPELLNRTGSIPSMMIQPIVENSILHGLSLLDYKGQLTISLDAHKKGIKCVVADNGRGRKAAALLAKENDEQHLSISAVNTRERLEFLREIGYENAAVEVEDLYQGQKGCGMVTTIYLPFMENEKSRI
jgi:tetratricopeptide (TPR) repeat protein